MSVIMMLPLGQYIPPLIVIQAIVQCHYHRSQVLFPLVFLEVSDVAHSRETDSSHLQGGVLPTRAQGCHHRFQQHHVVIASVKMVKKNTDKTMLHSLHSTVAWGIL